MLMGEFHHNIDPKGRLIIPAKFRQQLGEQFVLTRGIDGCLFGYSLIQWQHLEKQLKKLPLTQHSARSFVRFFYSAASECSLDKQGRVNISNVLIEYAELSQNCVIAGVLDHIEIWNAGKWQKISDKAADDFAKTSEELQNLVDFD